MAKIWDWHSWLPIVGKSWIVIVPFIVLSAYYYVLQDNYWVIYFMSMWTFSSAYVLARLTWLPFEVYDYHLRLSLRDTDPFPFLIEAD